MADEVKLSNGEKVTPKPIGWMTYKALRRLVTTKLASLTSSGSDGMAVIRQAFNSLTPQPMTEALTEEQAALPQPSLQSRLGRDLIEVATEFVGVIGVADEAVAEITEMLVSTGCAGMTEADVMIKLADWSASDVLGIRDAVWSATDWDGIRKAEVSFFGKAGAQLGHLVPGQTA